MNREEQQPLRIKIRHNGFTIMYWPSRPDDDGEQYFSFSSRKQARAFCEHHHPNVPIIIDTKKV